MDYFLKRAQELKETIIADRHHLHKNPEVGMNLPETTKYVMGRLAEMGIEATEICQSGVLAVIKGKKPGKTYLVRGDMDALPMNEDNNLSFKSVKPGMAHNCGHDMHAAMLLCTAQMLKEKEDELEGTVKLMFQPAEETFEGAKAMIAAGALDGVDAASACHVMLDWVAPSYGCKAGYMASSCDGFKITVKGKGCHGAMPETGIDPINAAVMIYQQFQELMAREKCSRDVACLTCGQLSAGTTANIIPAEAVLQGTLRTYSQTLREKLVKRMHEIIKGVAIVTGAEINYEVLSDVPACYTNPELLAELQGYVAELNIPCMDEGYMITASDDMAFVSENVPTTYFLLGGKVEGHPFAHHNPKVLFDEKCMPYGAAMNAQCAFNWLKNHKDK